MNTLLIQLPENSVFLKDGHAITTSLKVAKVFGKRHKNVIKVIRNIGCPDEFWRLNFEPSNYLDERGKTQLMYEITKDGFTFLVMGFTGPQATQFKIAYINRFNEMDTTLRQEFIQPNIQHENYWFARRPLWPPIRLRVLAGEAYRDIAAALQISRGRVARAVRSMIRVGLLAPLRVAEVQRGPAKKAALNYSEGWGRPIAGTRQLGLFDMPQIA